MRIDLQYLHNPHLGYGRYGTDLHRALTAAGVHVDTRLAPDGTDPANVACWVSTPNHALGWHRDQHLVLSTMWEAMTLPEQFRENLHNFDRIIVPSRHNMELFGRYHPNVSYVPLGIDNDRWAYQARQPPAERFVFLIGGSGTRKGLDLAYRAFRRLWPTPQSWPADAPRPTLIFKSPKPADWHGDRIEHVTGHISEQSETDLYAMAHCYLQPSRGEGFGLQPLQAIAQGVPTILTDAHGHTAFSHLGYGIPAGRSKADYFIHGDAGDWWEPDLDALCDQMRWVYDHYDQAAAFASEASQVAHRQFTWANTARLFIDTIGADRLAVPYTGTGGWVTPTLRRYPVRVNRPWRAEICGKVHIFTPGETTWETADVKRIMAEAGLLDPACIVRDRDGTPDITETGLTPDQVEAVGGRSATAAHCPTCGQILGTGTRWDPEPEPVHA